MKGRVRQAWNSPALRAAAAFALGGVGFAVGNLVLARHLSVEEYGVFALILALLSLAMPLAPAGIDGVVNRRVFASDRWLLSCVLVTSLLTAVVTSVAGSLLYSIGAVLLAGLFVGVVAGGATMLAAAQFQSQHRFTAALVLSQSPNLVLAAAAVLVVVLQVHTALVPLGVYVIGVLIAAAWGWAKLFQEGKSGPTGGGGGLPWGEAFSYAGVSGVGIALLQLERLLIPKVLTLEELATYGVLAAIVGSPYRVLQLGAGYTLLPRLRAAETPAVRRKVLYQEGGIMAFIAIMSAAAILPLAPLFGRWFFAGKYSLSGSLVLAAILTGILKMANGFLKGTVTALADTRQLSYMNLFGWLSVGLAILGGSIGARWGLTGLIYGVGIGWLGRTLAALSLSLPHLRDQSGVSARAVPSSHG